jgi:hypothetical protein
VELFQAGWPSGPALLAPAPLGHGPELADIARVSSASNLLMSAFAGTGGSAAKTVDARRSLIKQRRVTTLESPNFVNIFLRLARFRLFRKSLAAVHGGRRRIECARTEVMLRQSLIPEISINFF